MTRTSRTTAPSGMAVTPKSIRPLCSLKGPFPITTQAPLSTRISTMMLGCLPASSVRLQLEVFQTNARPSSRTTEVELLTVASFALAGVSLVVDAPPGPPPEYVGNQ